MPFYRECDWGSNLDCMDVYTVLVWANDTKYYLIATKHKIKINTAMSRETQVYLGDQTYHKKQIKHIRETERRLVQ